MLEYERNQLTCPVCGYNKLEFPPEVGSSCSCCGTVFGNDTFAFSLRELRLNWIQRGFPFYEAESRPENWNFKFMVRQLENIAYANESGELGFVFEQGLIDYFVCPVCGYNKMLEPPLKLQERRSPKCPCCYTSFGYDDRLEVGSAWFELRRKWIENGCQFALKGRRPKDWGIDQARAQLKNITYSHFEGFRGWEAEQGGEMPYYPDF